MEGAAVLSPKLPAASEPANKSPSSELPLNPPKAREEGELSSDDNDENPICSVPHPTVTSVPPPGPMLVPPMTKFSQGNQVGKVVASNNLASSADILPQTLIQSTSQKSNDKNRMPLKSAKPGWRAPLGPKDNLVISFSDDDSRSDSEEKEHRKENALVTKSHMTGVVANGKPPNSTLEKSNKFGQTARNVKKVMSKKLSSKHTFIPSMTKLRGVNFRDAGPSSFEQGSRGRTFNSLKKNLVSGERGSDQGVGLNNSELQDLRLQIALRESELRLKSAQRTKESVTCTDDNAMGLPRDGASKFSVRSPEAIQMEPKEPDKKRLKVGGSFSTQLSKLGPKELPVAKSILPSKDPAVEDNNPRDTVKIDHGQQGIPVGPTESSIVNWQNHNDKHVAGISENIHSGVKNGAGINTKCIQSDGRSKQVDPYVMLNQATRTANMTCNNFPKNLSSVELNHANRNGSHLEQGSLNKSTSGKNLVRSSDHREVISSDKRLDPTFFDTCQASLNNASLRNCFGNANVTEHGDMNIHSLVEMEETMDKDLDEAQDYRRRCEIEERDALKAYRKAQRALLEANARCADLYRKRELYSANLRSFIVDNSSLLWSSRQNEQAGIGLDQTNNLSENVDLIPTSSHMMQPQCNDFNPAVCDSDIQHVNSARIHTSYKPLGGQNMGSEPCSEPDASTSEPVPLLGNNAADGVFSPSNEPNSLADEEDEETFSFENESAQPNFVCHGSTNFGKKQKDIDNESNGKMCVDGSQDSLLLERVLRSELFARLGTKDLSKNGSSCNEPGEERGDENDFRSEKTQNINGSFPFSEAEKDQQFDHEGTDEQEKSFSEAPPEIQREHSVENSLNSHSTAYSEDIFSFREGHHSFTSVIFSPSNILRSAFGYMKVISPNNLIEHQARSQQSQTCDTNIEEGACINSDKTQISSTMVDPTKDTLVKLGEREVGSYTTGPAVDPFWPLCMYELRGKCNNDECPWQHAKDYSNTDMYHHQQDNSDSADCQVGLTLHQKKCDGSTKVPRYHNAMTSPTYLVGLGILKADHHSYESVLARRNGQCWKKCFSLSLALSNSFQKDFPSDRPSLHGNDGRLEVPVSWNRETSYFQSRNGGVNQLKQHLADNDQYLEMALLIFSQEASDLEGMRKVLPVLSEAIEADPTSIILWIVYLLIYYSNKKSVGKDDMFSCAVKFNDQSYELWLMCVNSRMQLSDQLATYDVAISALCRHASASKDGMYASACILDLFLQMMDCLCMSGNVEKAIQKIFGLFTAATNFDEPNSPSLSDIQTCLTVSDKFIFGVCCVYLVIYRKLPDAVVRQFECQKELFEIEWSSVQLINDEKQRAVKLMEAVEDSVEPYMKTESLEKSEFDLRVAQFFALNHLRCMAALDSLESCRNLLGKYLNSFPACLELVIISARVHKHDIGDLLFEGFEEVLSNWPQEIPGIQCIWNQYVEYVLQNGRLDFGKVLMDRWFHSVWEVHYLQNDTMDHMKCDNSDISPGLASDSSLQKLISNPKQIDIMFGYLNLSVHKFLQNDHIEARLALDRALKAAVPEYFKHCMREHALFMLTDESLLKENACISGIQKILEHYLGYAKAFPASEPLSRKFINSIKKPRVRQLVSNVFSPFSSDFSLVNSVLEVWYGPSLLPKKFSEPKHLVDFVEAILDISPSNYQLAISVCKVLSSFKNATDVTSASVWFWASSNLVSAIFHAVPIPPEYVWVEAAEILGNIAGAEVISERFYKRALSVYPFSVKLWKSYYVHSMMTTGNMNTVVEAAKEKGIELG